MPHSAGGYKAVLSLGSTCQTAYQLQRLGLRKFAGPLDWFVSESVDGLVRLMGNRFGNFMELRNLEAISVTQECFVVRDHVHQVLSFHDFPLSHGQWWDAYPTFKQTLNRRVVRFLDVIRQEPMLFVRTDTNRRDAQLLQRALNTLRGGESQLLIVNHHHHDGASVWEEHWGLNGIRSVQMPTGADWRGSDPAWDFCMNGVMTNSLYRKQK